MSGTRQLHIGFCLTPTWLKGRRAEPDELPSSHDPASFYIDLAKRAEQAKLDFAFKVDYLALNPAMAGGQGGPGLEPNILLAAIARETQRIGLVATHSTTFNPPYIVARQIQSLHWLSQGRAGWNIVTSIEGAENFGDAPMPPPEARYRKAAEFTDVVRRLWQSYPPVGADCLPQAHPIDHAGEFFSVKGPLNVRGHESGPPPIFQAGASDIGREFAASVADATFASAPDMAAGIDLRSDLRARAERLGRRADDIRVLPGLYFFLAPTREEASELHRRAHAHLNHERRVESVRTVLGLDISRLGPASRVTPDMLPVPDAPVRSRTHADLLRRFIEANSPTVGELLARPEVVGSAHWVSVGTVDGFIALPGGSTGSLDLFFEELVPALAARGLFRTEYEGTTLRAHLRMS
jgi:FMN-dependent oxidoreductase (nitrilotriacetate monooxygenase family)